MEERKYSEWTYENFSCWDKNVHEKVISYNLNNLDLYPRGLNGDGEHLVVQVFDPMDSSRVEVSFIGGDGSLLCKREVQDPEWEGNLVTLPPGPTFEEVVRASKNNKDVLVLRLYLSDNNKKYCGCTTIDVSERCVKIPASVFKIMKMKTPFYILNFNYDDGQQTSELNVSACLQGQTRKDAEIYIDINPDTVGAIRLVRVCASLLNCDDVIIRSKEGKRTFCGDEPWSLPTNFKLKEVNENEWYMTVSIKLIFKDIRFTTCEVLNEVVEFSSSTRKPLENSGILTASSDSPTPTALSQELMCLYQDQDFSDFTLKCDNVSIPVHKNILSARSPVFKRMLSCDMREAASSEVVITDLDPSTLARFLAFLYTGNVENLQCDIAMKLYIAADKYQVPTLKKICADFLCANVSISNVCDILLLADSYQDDLLTSVVHDFIWTNYNAVLCSEEWKAFMIQKPLLCAKTLTQFAEKKRMGAIGN